MTDQLLQGAPRLTLPPPTGPRLPDERPDLAAAHPDDPLAVLDALLDPEPPAPVTLSPTLVPRLLTLAGGVGTLAVLVNAVLRALRASDWARPRPLIEPRLGAAVAVLVLAGLWWGVAAAVNARRVSLHPVVHPAVVLGYLLPVAAWVGVDRVAEGDLRRWAWAGWCGLTVVVHYAVAIAFRNGSSTLGAPNSHFTAAAVLPLLTAAAAVPSVFARPAVFALPMATALAVWFVVELWQAMCEWDATCRERTHVRRDLPQMAPALLATRRSRRDDPGAVPFRDPADGAGQHHFHTKLPRAMVVASFLFGLSLPAWAFLLERKGHLHWAGRHTTVDLDARRLLAAIFVAMLGSYAVGWLWWSAAAAANARRLARWSISPLLAPFGYLVVVGVVAVVPEVERRVQHQDRGVVIGVGALVAVIAHFGVLRAYSGTAEDIGAPVAPWRRVVALPWAAVAFSLLVAFFGQMLSNAVFAIVLGAAWVLFYLAYAISFYQAMAGFDGACTGRRLLRADMDEVPEFLKKRR